MKEFEKANDWFNELVEKGITKRRGNNLLSTVDKTKNIEPQIVKMVNDNFENLLLKLK